MPTITTQIIQSNRDDILIYEVGRKAQEINADCSDGLPILRLTKTLAAILRHWDVLRSHSKYRAINSWESLHAPFRYGQIIYRKSDPGETNISNDYGVSFIENVIDRSVILLSLLVKPEASNEFDKVQSKILFPSADPFHYGTLIKDSGIENPDLEILRSLAAFYAYLDLKTISVLATCPSHDACKKAIIAEIVLWIHDIDKIFRLLKDLPGNTAYQAPRINEYMKKAFECGRQIGEKIKWFLSLNKAQDEIIKITVAKEISKSIIAPLSESLKTGKETEELLGLKLVSKIMTGFLSLIETHVYMLFPSIHLPETGDSKVAQDFVVLLEKVGIEPYFLEELILISGKKTPSSLLDLLEKLESIYNNNILKYLTAQGLPSKFDRKLLFPEI